MENDTRGRLTDRHGSVVLRRRLREERWKRIRAALDDAQRALTDLDSLSRRAGIAVGRASDALLALSLSLSIEQDDLDQKRKKETGDQDA